MPRPIAPGVLGMARTMRAFGPHAADSDLVWVPAAMEIISAPLAAKSASSGASLFNSWGLIATTQAAMRLAATFDGALTSVIFFFRARLLIAAGGFGSTAR